MSDTPVTTPVPPQQGQAPITTPQAVRQVVVIVVILAIWTAVLIGYLALTKPSEEAPAAAPASPQATGISFSDQVLPLFEARCQRCHGTGRADGGLGLATHADVMAGSDYGPVVVPVSAGTSRLVDVLLSGEMPLGGRPLDDYKIQTISDWIDAGAPNN
jgi:mono/diheme cytochrome c family protein